MAAVRGPVRHPRQPSPFTRRRVLLGVAVMAALCGSALVSGQSSENHEIRRSVIVGGGKSESERYAVTGALGQAEADPTSAISERFWVQGGFFTAELAERPDALFSDGFEG